MIIPTKVFDEYVTELTEYYQQRVRENFAYGLSSVFMEKGTQKLDALGVNYKQYNFYSDVGFYIYRWLPYNKPDTSLPECVTTWIDARIWFEMYLERWDGFNVEEERQIDKHIAIMESHKPAIEAFMIHEYNANPNEMITERAQFQKLVVRLLVQEEK